MRCPVRRVRGVLVVQQGRRGVLLSRDGEFVHVWLPHGGTWPAGSQVEALSVPPVVGWLWEQVAEAPWRVVGALVAILLLAGLSRGPARSEVATTPDPAVVTAVSLPSAAVPRQPPWQGLHGRGRPVGPRAAGAGRLLLRRIGPSLRW